MPEPQIVSQVQQLLDNLKPAPIREQDVRALKVEDLDKLREDMEASQKKLIEEFARERAEYEKKFESLDAETKRLRLEIEAANRKASTALSQVDDGSHCLKRTKTTGKPCQGPRGCHYHRYNKE